MSLVLIATKDGQLSINGHVVCHVERDEKILVIDVSLVSVGEVCWLINNDVWGMRLS